MQTKEPMINIFSGVAETLLEQDISDSVRMLRLNALKELWRQIEFYKKLGYCEKLLKGLESKKVKMILQASYKKDFEKILKPHCPYFDGNKFIPDNYNVPEEELICWCQTSLNAPLNDVAFSRYREVFCKVFPEYGKLI